MPEQTNDIQFVIRSLKASRSNSNDESSSQKSKNESTTNKELVTTVPNNDDDVLLQRELLSGVALLRGITAFVSLDVGLHEELACFGGSFSGSESTTHNSDDDDGASSNKRGMLPSFPVNLEEDGMVISSFPKDDDNDDAKRPWDEALISGNNSNSLRSYYVHSKMNPIQRQYLAARLSDYLSSLLQIPSVVGSRALADFFALDADFYIQDESDSNDPNNNSNTNEMEIDNSNKKSFADYLLQGDNEEKSITIARRDKFVYNITDLPPGWWLVWQFRVQTTGRSPVEFQVDMHDKVFGEDANDQANAASSSGNAESSVAGDNKEKKKANIRFVSTTVLQETVDTESRQIIQGSYRCEPDHNDDDDDNDQDSDNHMHTKSKNKKNKYYSITFSNTASLFRSAQISFAVACVPHEAYVSACKAADDQCKADARRDRAPLLKRILDSIVSDPVSLMVSPYAHHGDAVHDDAHQSSICNDKEAAQEEKKGDGCDAPSQLTSSLPSNQCHPDSSSNRTNNDYQLLSMRKQISILQSTNQDQTAEITNLNDSISTLSNKLNRAQSEKKVWLLTKTQVQEELTNTSKLYQTQKKDYHSLSAAYEDCKRDKTELKCEVEYLTSQIPSQKEWDQLRHDLQTAEGELDRLHDTNRILTSEYKKLLNGRDALDRQLELDRGASRDMLAMARAEADEARMMQRILEGKLRDLEELTMKNIREKSIHKQQSEKVHINENASATKHGTTTTPKIKNGRPSITLSTHSPISDNAIDENVVNDVFATTKHDNSEGARMPTNKIEKNQDAAKTKK